MKRQSIGSWSAGVLLGLALFYVLVTYFDHTIDWYHINLSFSNVWLVFVAALLGPIGAGVVAFFGQILGGVTTGTIWWTWVISEGLYGLLLGLIVQRLLVRETTVTWRKLVIFNIWQSIANILVWLIVAPFGDHWIYGLHMHIALQRGIGNTIGYVLMTFVIGSLMLVLYHRLVSNAKVESGK